MKYKNKKKRIKKSIDARTNIHRKCTRKARPVCVLCVRRSFTESCVYIATNDKKVCVVVCVRHVCGRYVR